MKQKTQKILDSYGFLPHLKGYALLIRAVEIYSCDKRAIPLYQTLDQEFSCVSERAMRNSISKAWENIDNKFIQKFNNTYGGKPTNIAFIAYLYNKVS